MSETLKPCPFCGGPAEASSVRNDRRRPSIIICASCEAASSEASTAKGAIAAWNHRVDPQREAMRSALEAWRRTHTGCCRDGCRQCAEDGNTPHRCALCIKTDAALEVK
jgi:Lar family restriction alleviation protein